MSFYEWQSIIQKELISMSMVEQLLQNVPLPKMIPVKQNFPSITVDDVAAALRSGINKPEIVNKIKPGMSVAITVGSRGMADIPLIVCTVVEELKKLGAKPFVVPAMGSHGGATAEGQVEVLASLGITEATIQCPIKSSMDVVEVGTTDHGMPVYIDKNAYEAGGIVVINRSKVHTAFSGPNESGMAKMITIGLGKQKGASICHARGYANMSEDIVKIANVSMAHANFLFGVGTIENAQERISKIMVVLPENLIEADQELLKEMKTGMPKILLQPLDILIVDYLGKEFSGGGMDPYITGRAPTPYLSVKGTQVSRLVVLDVSASSHGNSNGIGMADITTRRLVNKIDFEAMYTNILTSTVTPSGRIPLIMESDKLAIQAAVKTCHVSDSKKLRMVRIPNTLHIDHILISEALVAEAEKNPNITICGSATEIPFDIDGNISDL
jgi:hypothetical protein